MQVSCSLDSCSVPYNWTYLVHPLTVTRSSDYYMKRIIKFLSRVLQSLFRTKMHELALCSIFIKKYGNTIKARLGKLFTYCYCDEHWFTENLELVQMDKNVLLILCRTADNRITPKCISTARAWRKHGKWNPVDLNPVHVLCCILLTYSFYKDVGLYSSGFIFVQYQEKRIWEKKSLQKTSSFCICMACSLQFFLIIMKAAHLSLPSPRLGGTTRSL